MAAYFVAIPAICIFLAIVPIKIAFIVRIAAHPGFGAGLSITEGRAFRKAHRFLNRSKPRKQKKKRIRPNISALVSATPKALRYLLRRMRLQKLHARGSISTRDAAGTALICGCIRALEGALIPHLGREKIRFALDADFSSGESNINLNGMVSLRAGHIIFAALIGAWNYIAATRRQTHGKTSH